MQVGGSGSEAVRARMRQCGWEMPVLRPSMNQAILAGWRELTEVPGWRVDAQRPASWADTLGYAAGNGRALTSMSLNCYGDCCAHLLWLLDDEDAAGLADRDRLVLPHWVSDGDMESWCRDLEFLAGALVDRHRARGRQVRTTRALASQELTVGLLEQIYGEDQDRLLCLRCGLLVGGVWQPAGYLVVDQLDPE